MDILLTQVWKWKWSRSVVSDSLPTRLLCLWDSPGKNTGVACHFLLQGIFPTQGSNPGLLSCRQTLYPLSHQGSPTQVYKMYNCFFTRQLHFFNEHHSAIRQKVHLSQVKVSVGGSQFGVLQGIRAGGHLSSATVCACWHLHDDAHLTVVVGPWRVPPLHRSQPQALGLSLRARPDAPPPAADRSLTRLLCPLGAALSGRWSPARLSATRLLLPPQGPGFPGSLLQQSGFSAVPLFPFPLAPFFSSLRTFSQLCSVWLVIASPKLLLRPIVPQSLGSETPKSVSILLLWHSFPEAKMPPALVDWMKERVGARQDTKKYSEGKKTSVENSNYSILS